MTFKCLHAIACLVDGKYRIQEFRWENENQKKLKEILPLIKIEHNFI